MSRYRKDHSRGRTWFPFSVTLLMHITGKILVVLDGCQIHRSNEIKKFWSKMQRNAFGLTPSSILSGSKSGWGSLEQFEKSVFEKPNLFWFEGTWKRVAKGNHAVSFPPPIDSGLFCPDRLCLNIKWNISNQWFLKKSLAGTILQKQRGLELAAKNFPPGVCKLRPDSSYMRGLKWAFKGSWLSGESP